MREKWTFSNGGFRERKREVERWCDEVEDDLGDKEGSPRSTPLTAARNRSPRSVDVTTGEPWCPLDTQFLGFTSEAPPRPY